MYFSEQETQHLFDQIKAMMCDRSRLPHPASAIIDAVGNGGSDDQPALRPARKTADGCRRIKQNWRGIDDPPTVRRRNNSTFPRLNPPL